MQTLNKSLMKNTFTYTWFIYPMTAVILSLVWLWSFPTFHQPSAHQKIDAFFATDIKSEEFANKILQKYERENLREINSTYAFPGTSLYAQKLQLALTSSDVLILPREHFERYRSEFALYFVEVTSYVQEKCQVEETRVCENYGILLKTKGAEHYLENYMTFDDKDYILVFSANSKNMGSAIDEDNAPYDNALTFVHYLLEGVE